MSRNRLVKQRVRENREKRKVMAWKRPIERLASLVSARLKMANNSQGGVLHNASGKAGLVYRAADLNPGVDAYLKNLEARWNVIRLIRSAVHHTQANEALAQLRSML